MYRPAFDVPFTKLTRGEMNDAAHLWMLRAKKGHNRGSAFNALINGPGTRRGLKARGMEQHTLSIRKKAIHGLLTRSC